MSCDHLFSFSCLARSRQSGVGWEKKTKVSRPRVTMVPTMHSTSCSDPMSTSDVDVVVVVVAASQGWLFSSQWCASSWRGRKNTAASSSLDFVGLEESEMVTWPHFLRDQESALSSLSVSLPLSLPFILGVTFTLPWIDAVTFGLWFLAMCLNIPSSVVAS